MTARCAQIKTVLMIMQELAREWGLRILFLQDAFLFRRELVHRSASFSSVIYFMQEKKHCCYACASLFYRFLELRNLLFNNREPLFPERFLRDINA